MKYLKKYENKNSLWLVVTEDYFDRDSGHQELFMDEESAQNNFLEIVNNYKKDNAKLITTIEEAGYYVEEELKNVCSIYYYEIAIRGKHELREDIKNARDSKKYNV